MLTGLLLIPIIHLSFAIVSRIFWEVGGYRTPHAPNPDDPKLDTLVKILNSYELNFEEVLRHGLHYYTWGQLPMKISLRLDKGNLNDWFFSIFLLNKSRLNQFFCTVPALCGTPAL